MKYRFKKFIYKALLLLCIVGLTASCSSSNNNEVICTMEFRIISIEVEGAELTSYFTIREATQDTLFLSEDLEFFNSYPILSDGEFDLFETNEIEAFRFQGFVDDELLIDEPYLLGADECHVFREEGKIFIDLSEE